MLRERELRKPEGKLNLQRGARAAQRQEPDGGGDPARKMEKTIVVK